LKECRYVVRQGQVVRIYLTVLEYVAIAIMIDWKHLVE
jgi:hypothetical protein